MNAARDEIGSPERVVCTTPTILRKKSEGARRVAIDGHSIRSRPHVACCYRSVMNRYAAAVWLGLPALSLAYAPVEAILKNGRLSEQHAGHHARRFRPGERAALDPNSRPNVSAFAPSRIPEQALPQLPHRLRPRRAVHPRANTSCPTAAGDARHSCQRQVCRSGPPSAPRGD